MALLTGWYKRGGANGGITDADGRGLTHETGGMADTQNISVSTSAPAAGTLTSISSLTVGGVYRAEVLLALSGTAETQLTNLRLRTNSANIAGGGVLPTLSAVTVPLTFPRVTIGADGVLSLFVQANATAGAIYTARLSATRVE